MDGAKHDFDIYKLFLIYPISSIEFASVFLEFIRVSSFEISL